MKPNANRFQKVFDNRNRRMRGLWQRNGAFYAQIRLTRGPPATRILLHNTSTVPQALTAMQALKKSRRDGELKIQKQRGIPTFSELADKYLSNLSLMNSKHEDTRRRESSSLDALKQYFGPRRVNQITMADATQYAVWRKAHPLRRGWDKVSGRAIDLDIIALRHVLDLAVESQFIKSNSITKWKKLAEDSKEVRLLSTEEVDTLNDDGFLDHFIGFAVRQPSLDGKIVHELSVDAIERLPACVVMALLKPAQQTWTRLN